MDRAPAEAEVARLQGQGVPGARLRAVPTWVVRYTVTPVATARPPSGDGDVLVFGKAPPEPPQPGAAPPADRPPAAWSAEIAPLWLEGGWLANGGSDVRASHYLRLDAAVAWDPAPAWTVALGGRLDGYRQTGTPSVASLQADYGPTYVRRRWADTRLTVGAQSILWGRVDEVPPSDGLGVRDGRRFLLDELADRRLAVPALRLEQFWGPWKADLVWVPWFREGELPQADSIWHPVDRGRGRILGIEPDPVLAGLLRSGTLGADEADGGGEGGVRLSYQGERVDFGVTAQRERRSLAYWELAGDVREAVLAGQPPAAAVAAGTGPTFRARHPATWLVGGDAALAAGAATWRLEAAWRSDVPVTTRDLRLATVTEWAWVAGAELYPGGGDVRVTLQAAGRHLANAPAVLDRRDAVNVNGSVEAPFGHGRWRARVRFLLGLDQAEHYVNPELAFDGWEPHRLYIGAHLFGGDDRTAGGYHADHDLLVAGLRLAF
jgi:hypothetical protein